MSDFWKKLRGTGVLFFFTDSAHTKLYEVTDLISEYCEEVGCDRCQFLDVVECTIPAYIQGAGAKELLWLLDEANIDWELYGIFPNDPLPKICRIRKGENYERE